MRIRQIGEGGLIKMIILIVIALLIVSYFGINLRTIADSPTTKDNFAYVATTTVRIWDNYLKAPATYVWDMVFVNLIWNPALDNLKKTVEPKTDISNI